MRGKIKHRYPAADSVSTSGVALAGQSCAGIGAAGANSGATGGKPSSPEASRTQHLAKQVPCSVERRACSAINRLTAFDNILNKLVLNKTLHITILFLCPRCVTTRFETMIVLG